MNSTEYKIKASPLRVMHIVNDLGYGGAQKSILELVRRIDRTIFHPVVGLWGKRWGHAMIRFFAESDIEVVDFGARRKFDLKALYAMYKYLAENSFDILHTHLFLMHGLGRIAGKLARIPRIVSTHHNLRQANHPLLGVLEKATLPFCDATISVSSAAQETYFRKSEMFSARALFSGRKHFTIYNSVDTDEIKRRVKKANVEQTRFDLGLTDNYVFICVGRLHPHKGYTYLIRALDQLRKIHPDVRLLIAGDGVLRAELAEETAARGLGNYINFLGYRDDVYELLKCSDALVQPSVFEGFGLASAEAMACGLPVISTNLPSIAEVVLHGATGILVPPEKPAALAKAMQNFIENKNLANTYGVNGKKRVEEIFSSKVVTRQYETLYQTLAAMP